MKSRFLAFCLSGLVVVAAGGCDYVPGPRKAALDAVKRELVDSSSAKFEDVEACPGNREMYRGRVNAKNRMGAYAGTTSFYTVRGLPYLGDSELELLLQKRGYSYVAHLSSACTFGINPDLQSYMAAVNAGTAPTLSELARETQEEMRVRLGLPPAS